MTEKEHRKSVEKLLVDLRAAKAFLNRVECQLRGLIGDNALNTLSDALERPYNASEHGAKEKTHATPSNAVKPHFRASDAISPILTQDDLFRDTTKMHKMTPNHAFSRKKGCITLSRKQVMDNFRLISSKKDLLDLADVNRVLGFHKSTSGSFVKLAVKRGDLGYIPVGKEMKFLPLDLRSFIAAYFKNQKKGL